MKFTLILGLAVLTAHCYGKALPSSSSENEQLEKTGSEVVGAKDANKISLSEKKSYKSGDIEIDFPLKKISQTSSSKTDNTQQNPTADSSSDYQPQVPQQQQPPNTPQQETAIPAEQIPLGQNAEEYIQQGLTQQDQPQLEDYQPNQQPEITPMQPESQQQDQPRGQSNYDTQLQGMQQQQPPLIGTGVAPQDEETNDLIQAQVVESPVPADAIILQGPGSQTAIQQTPSKVVPWPHLEVEQPSQEPQQQPPQQDSTGYDSQNQVPEQEQIPQEVQQQQPIESPRGDYQPQPAPELPLPVPQLPQQQPPQQPRDEYQPQQPQPMPQPEIPQQQPLQRPRDDYQPQQPQPMPQPELPQELPQQQPPQQLPVDNQYQPEQPLVNQDEPHSERNYQKRETGGDDEEPLTWPLIHRVKHI